jgi:predicted metal-dependent hydrolase
MPKRTPADLTIRPRNVSFLDAATAPRWWAGGDPIATAFYNALSATFPQGERFFIDTVRHYRHAVPDAMQGDVAAFIAQESMHTREHVLFNEAVRRAGYDLTAIDALQTERLKDTRSRHPIAQLCSTVAIEHLTAIFANAILTDPRHLDGAPEMTRALWRWHSMEEIEHKAVAFDTYMAAASQVSPFRRWKIRCVVMAFATVRFTTLIGRSMAALLSQDGIDMRRRKWAVAKFLLIKPGMVRTILASYLQFYLPGFHPWRHDDRHLLDMEQALLDALELAAA